MCSLLLPPDCNSIWSSLSIQFGNGTDLLQLVSCLSLCPAFILRVWKYGTSWAFLLLLNKMCNKHMLIKALPALHCNVFCVCTYMVNINKGIWAQKLEYYEKVLKLHIGYKVKIGNITIWCILHAVNLCGIGTQCPLCFLCCFYRFTAISSLNYFVVLS